MDCARAQHQHECTCSHIAAWYSDVFPFPCGFWTFDTAMLQPPVPNPHAIPTPILINQPSHTGDQCHYNIHNLGDSRAKRILDTEAANGGLGLCVNGIATPFDPTTATALKEQYFPDPS
jgi:hypothetical protein